MHVSPCHACRHPPPHQLCLDPPEIVADQSIFLQHVALPDWRGNMASLSEENRVMQMEGVSQGGDEDSRPIYTLEGVKIIMLNSHPLLCFDPLL